MTPVLGTFTISSIATDYPVFWLAILSGWVSLRFLEGKIQPVYALWFSSILFLWGITLKLSSLPFISIPISLLIIKKRRVKHFFKPLVKGISFYVFFLLLPWVARFFMMSGCFFYPISITCVPNLKWGVPINSVIWMSEHIRRSAIILPSNPTKIPFFWFTDSTLLKYWIDRYFGYVETWFLLCFMILGLVIYILAKKNGEKQSYSSEIILLLPYVAGVVFFFFSSPAIRFGSG